MPTTLPIDSKDFLKKATSVASHYGFVPMETIFTKNRAGSTQKERNVYNTYTYETKKDLFSNELAAVAETCMKHNVPYSPRPRLIYHATHTKNEKGEKTESQPLLHFGLSALGIEKGIADGRCRSEEWRRSGEIPVPHHREGNGPYGHDPGRNLEGKAVGHHQALRVDGRRGTPCPGVLR